MTRLGLVLAIAATVTMIVDCNIPYNVYQAEHFDAAYGVQVSNDCPKIGSAYMGTIYPVGYIQYKGLDFGAYGVSGAELITIRVASLKPANVTGSILLRLDSVTAAPFAVLPIQMVGPTWCDFISVHTFLPNYITTIHDLFITFKSNSSQPFVNIDWFQFSNNAMLTSS